MSKGNLARKGRAALKRLHPLLPPVTRPDVSKTIPSLDTGGNATVKPPAITRAERIAIKALHDGAIEIERPKGNGPRPKARPS